MDYKEARKHMVDSQVRPNDVTDLRIQRAFEVTPREIFLPAELKPQAYVDREVAYAPDRSMISARDFSKLLAALEIEPGDLVLDVACGSGYSSAILAQLSEMVVAIENDETLSAKAQDNWGQIGVVNAAVVNADPVIGAPKQGPFDAIVIAGVIEVEPSSLLAQLKDGGRLGAILRRGDVAKGVIWRRSGSAFGLTEAFDAAARRTLKGFTRPKAFVF